MQLLLLVLIVLAIGGMWIRNILINRKQQPSMTDTRPTPTPTNPVIRYGVLHSVQNTTTESHVVAYTNPSDHLAITNVVVRPIETIQLCVMNDTKIFWLDINDAGPIQSLDTECTE